MITTGGAEMRADTGGILLLLVVLFGACVRVCVCACVRVHVGFAHGTIGEHASGWRRLQAPHATSLVVRDCSY